MLKKDAFGDCENRRTQTTDVSERRAEENIWTYDVEVREG